MAPDPIIVVANPVGLALQAGVEAGYQPRRFPAGSSRYRDVSGVDQVSVFISWSGERSGLLAKAIKDWLPKVLQFTKPWLSEEDIEPGRRWSDDLAKSLAQSKIAIICLTEENLTAPWILFEAGAVAKNDKSRLIPILLGVNKSDLKGPLAQFQAKGTSELDFSTIASSVNRFYSNGLVEGALKHSFEREWPDLKKKINSIPLSRTEALTYDSRSDPDLAGLEVKFGKLHDRDGQATSDTAVAVYSKADGMLKIERKNRAGAVQVEVRPNPGRPTLSKYTEGQRVLVVEGEVKATHFGHTIWIACIDLNPWRWIDNRSIEVIPNEWADFRAELQTEACAEIVIQIQDRVSVMPCGSIFLRNVSVHQHPA